ncbi:hypothetical protein WD019_09995 [Fictibacillus sp. Mic-4]|uniref:hypothetical protein n=1 Tax=Fictibacillus TaxID=1329200 RepID=UPI0003FE1625|nr:hypothetical protein [Fictibacillus gelatini]
MKKKFIFPLLMLCIVLAGGLAVLGCTINYKNYWVIQKEKYDEAADMIDRFPEKAAQQPNVKGYSVYTISEGRKMLAIAVGGEYKGHKVELERFSARGDTTHITIKIKKGKTTEANPVILIGVNKLHKKIVVEDTSGTRYKKIYW